MDNLTNETKEKIERLLQQYRDYQEADSREIKNKISDEMFFATPLVWFGYKYFAYQGTSRAINTLGDLRQHCSDKTDICTKRFNFIAAELVKININLKDEVSYPNFLELPKLLVQPSLIQALSVEALINAWQDYEYFSQDGKVKKWWNYL